MTETVAASYQAALAALEKAREVLSDLMRDKAAAVARQLELAKTRERLALAGLAGGAAADRKALDEVTTDSARIHLTVENLTFAITAARQEVDAATGAVNRAAARVNTSAAMGMVGELRTAGTRCSEAMTKFLVAYDEILAISNDIRRLGARWPNREVFSSSVRRSLEHHLCGRKLTAGAPVTAPGSRRELDAMLEFWVAELEISLERQLDQPELDDEAAE